MLKRAAFVVFFVCGGFLFLIPYWILFGTRASRERKALLREQRQTNRLLAARPGGTIGPSPDGRSWWNGQQWVSALSEDGRFRWDGYRWTPLLEEGITGGTSEADGEP